MFLCRIDELEENRARGFVQQDMEIIVIKRDGQVYAYKNACPHTGVNLNWQPDEFMDLDGYYLQCSVHGALFKVENGLCVRGPCVNRSLIPLDVRVENAEVYLPAIEKP